MIPSDRRYSQHARRSLIRAQRLAQAFAHEAVYTDHVILGILRTESSIGYQVLAEFQINPQHAEAIVREMYPPLDKPVHAPPFSKDLHSVLMFAIDEANFLGHHYIGTEHILLGLVRSGTGQLSNLLLQLQIGSHQVRQRIRHLLSEGAYETNFEAVRRSARLSELSRRTLNAAAKVAEEHAHHTAGLEHLLLVLAREQRSVAARLLLDAGFDEAHLTTDVRKAQFDAIWSATGLEEVLARAVYLTEFLGMHYTGTDHILLAMTLDDEAVALLKRYHVNVARLQQALKVVFGR